MKLVLTPPKNPYDSNLGRLFGACNSKQEGRQRAEQVARHIIEAVRNY